MQPLVRQHLPGPPLSQAREKVRKFATQCGLGIEIHDNVNTLKPFLAEWDELAARCPDATFFAGPEWAAAWTQQQSHAGQSVSLIMARERGRLVALLALTAHRVGPLRSATALSSGASAYSDLLADDASIACARLSAAVWFAIDQLGVDTVTFDAVREGSKLEALLAMRRSLRSEAQRAVLVQTGTHSANMIGTTSLRKDLRRRRRRLAEEKGPICYSVVQSEHEIAHAVAALLALKLAWLDDKGLHARFLARPETHSWLACVCTRALQAGKLHLSVLSVSGNIVAAQLAFRSGSTLCAYIGAFDPGYKRYGVGKLHLEDHLSDIAARGLSLDLMPPEDAYKLEWGVPGVRVRSYVVPLTARGRALAFLQSPNLRTMIKSLYMSMPRAARAKTAATVLAMAAAVRRTLMSLATPVGELAPHLSQAAAFA